MARYWSRDITARRRKPAAPRNTKTQACKKQAAKEIVCFPKRKMTSNLGIIALVKQHSKKEKMRRKKYTGVRSLESAQVVVTITVLPAMDARYARECTRKRIFPRRWTAGKPSKVNSWTLVPFFISMDVFSHSASPADLKLKTLQWAQKF